MCNKGDYMKKLLAILLAAVTFAATAQDITGAGATFPAPLYSKWASEYNKQPVLKSTINQLVLVQVSSKLKQRL